MQGETEMQQIPFVDLAAQHAAIADEINAAIADVIHHTDFILGRDVGLFEQAFASYCDVEYGVSLDSGTSALELALRAYGIGAGDEVITVTNTFIATAFAITYTGATPVLVDIDPNTYTIDTSKIEQAITPRTKAIMPVHLYGHPADMDPIMHIAEKHGLIVIEDACQAHGARYKGRRVGSIGHAAAFSFYPAKNLGAYGDGGMLVTNDRNIADTVQMFRNYGQREKYHHVVQASNRRLDTLQAAVLRRKLPHLDAGNEARRRHAALYNQLLAGSVVVTPRQEAYAEAVWHLYVIRVPDRSALRAHLAENLIASGIHYPVPVHLQPAYRELGYQHGDFPVAEQQAEQIVSLPMYPELTPGMIEYVAETIIAHVDEQLLERTGTA